MHKHPLFPFGVASHDPLLFCLPYAGGGASTFMPWRRQLSDVGLTPVQYPGHETRLEEACADDLDALVTELAEAVSAQVAHRRRYGLLGYSMGARLAFAVAHRLATLGAPPPSALHVIAHSAPNAAPARADVARLPDADLLAHVRAYDGTPDDVFDHPDLVAMMLPILRADFALVEQAVPQEPVDCPILAYAGIADRAARPDAMRAWQGFTRSTFLLRQFDGGHFFARGNADFLTTLAADIHGWSRQGAVIP